MNGWEIECWKSQRACRDATDPSSYQVEVRRKMDAIFLEFCTPKERKLGRQGSFQKPPEYDPEKEEVFETTLDEVRKRAYVTTHREAVLGGGRYRYALVRKHGRWLIDTLKHERNGEWENRIL